MSSILYGIHSTSNGHLAKSSVLVTELRRQGHKVDVIFSGAPRHEDDWFTQQLKPLRHYRGLVGYTHKGKFCRTTTFKETNLRQLVKDVNDLDLQPYEIVISDFDHVSAWAAKLQKKMTLGISRASTLFYNIPKAKRFFFANHFMYLSVPVTIHLGLHWHHFNQPILPPILSPNAVQYTESQDNELITVYLPTEQLVDIEKLLSPCSTIKFHIYHYQIDVPIEKDNLFFFPPNQAGFQESLRQCSGVICNAGFNLISEALVMKKNILVKPVRGFAEQVANALALQKIGAGTVMNNLDSLILTRWLQDSTQPKEFSYPNVAAHLAKWIRAGEWQQLPELSKNLWSQSIIQGELGSLAFKFN